MKVSPLNTLPPLHRASKVLWLGGMAGVVTFVSAGCGTSSGRMRLGPAGRTVLKFREAVADMAIAPDGTLAAVGTDDNYRGTHPVRLQTASGASSEVVPKLGNARMERVGFSPDGSRLVAVSQWGIWIAQLQNGAVMQHIATPIQSARGQRFYAMRSVGRPLWQKDGSIACISGGAFGEGPVTATYWNQTNATFIKSQIVLPGERDDLHLSAWTLAPDASVGIAVWTRVTRSKKSIQLGSSGRIEIIEVPSGRVRRVLEAIEPKGLSQPAISTDNALIAAADDTGRGWVWNTRNGELVLSLSGLSATNSGYSGSFSGGGFARGARLAFLPDGRRLVAARDDGSLVIYSLQTGLPLARIGQQTGSTGKILASPDGKRVYATAPNGIISEWSIPPETS